MEKQKLVVHFGANLWVPGSHGARKMNANEKHVVFEPFIAASRGQAHAQKAIALGTVKKLKKSDASLEGRLEYRLHSAEHTGLENGCADEVHIHDVFTDPGVSEELATSLLAEACRILGKNGSIFILHSSRPKNLPLSKLRDLAETLGLKLQVLVDHADEIAKEKRPYSKQEMELIREHVGESGLMLKDQGSYLAKLTKKS